MGLAEALRETIGVLSGVVDLYMGTEGLDEAIWHLQAVEVDNFRPTVLYGGRCTSQGKEVGIFEELTISSQNHFSLTG